MRNKNSGESTPINYIEILETCASIAKERQSQYGNAKNSIEDTTKILDVLFNIKLTPQEFCKVMIAGKLSREKFQHKDDNILDIINYLAIMQSL